MQTYPKYDEDFYGWLTAEVNLLRQHKFNELDIDHLIEELECMGRSEKREIVSRLIQLLKHLLKWQYQPEFQCRSWKDSIRNQRRELKDVLDSSPSLKVTVHEKLDESYKRAVEGAVEETGVFKKNFPQECPYSFKQLIDDEFYPE